MVITNFSNDLGVRQALASTAVLQQAVDSCCCGKQQSPPAAALSITQTSAVVVVTPPGSTLELTGVQVSVKATNSGSQMAADVVITVNLSPTLESPPYGLSASGWASSSFSQLVSPAFSLAQGDSQNFVLTLIGGVDAPAVTVTSSASATAAGGVSVSSNPLHFTVG